MRMHSTTTTTTAYNPPHQANIHKSSTQIQCAMQVDQPESFSYLMEETVDERREITHTHTQTHRKKWRNSIGFNLNIIVWASVWWIPDTTVPCMFTRHGSARSASTIIW